LPLAARTGQGSDGVRALIKLALAIDSIGQLQG
jgi:hypothetical protein